MPGLIASLLNNSQALDAQSQALAITGKNLANINNVGYARQRVVLGSLGSITTATGTQSMGVAVLGITQLRDILLDRQLQRDISKTSSLDARQAALQSADSALGQQINRTSDSASIGAVTTGTGSGINENLSTLFAGFESWSVNPSAPGEQQLLIQKASILADKINTTDANLAQVQSSLTDQVTTDVTKVNDILKTISDLNSSIARAENVMPDSAVDLRDQRQAKIEDLAQYMDFTVQNIPGSHGQVSLSGKDAANNPVDLINPTLTGPLTFDGTHFSAGSPATQLALTGGSLQSRIDVRDGTVADTCTQLKALADQLTTSVNAAYNPANDVGKNFFAAAPATGLIQIEATATNLRATLSGTSGGNELATAVAGLASTSFSTGSGDLIDGSFSSHFSGMVATLGLDLSNTTTRLEDQTLSETNTRQNRDAVSGVSQDEELTNMLQFQRSYQACARFTNAIDGLLDIVVNKLGSF
jgi:flagellar hook-associated protein 1 FlgK